MWLSYRESYFVFNFLIVKNIFAIFDAIPKYYKEYIVFSKRAEDAQVAKNYFEIYNKFKLLDIDEYDE